MPLARQKSNKSFQIEQIFLLPVFPSETLALTKHSAEKRGRFSEVKSRMPLTSDLLGDGEETTDDKGAVGVRLAPGLHLFAKFGIMCNDEERQRKIAGDVGFEV